MGELNEFIQREEWRLGWKGKRCRECAALNASGGRGWTWWSAGALGRPFWWQHRRWIKGSGPFAWGLSRLPGRTPHRGIFPACCHHPTAHLSQGLPLAFLLASLDLELVLAFPDLELVLVFPDLGLVLVFLALGQVRVQVRGLLAWAEMTPELREGRLHAPSQHTPQHLIEGLIVNSPLGSPEQSDD